MLDAALAYAEMGWPIFPVKSDQAPHTTNGVLDATTDPKQIEEWYERWPRANIALDVGGAGYMVLDIDPGADRAALSTALGGLPETRLTSRTPRGGTHLFYSLAAEEIVAPSSNKLSPHVDVRSFHSYVLLPPSRGNPKKGTENEVYEWESEGKPAYRTDEMVRLANSGGRRKSEDRDTWLIEPDLPENVAAATEWLRNKAKIAVEGQGGDHTTYATAAMMKSYGLSEATAFDLLWQHWNPRCSPPWDDGDLENKITNGYKFNTSQPGNVTNAYHVAKSAVLFKPVLANLPSGRQLNSGRFRFVDRAGMAHIQPPAWLIPNFLPAGAYAILFGAPGTFKTFIALDIALSIAVGWPINPTWPEIGAAGPVLYCLGEGRPEMAKRVAAWEQTHFGGDHVPGFFLGDPVPGIGEDAKPFIDGALAMSPNGYKLVVIDTVGRSMQGQNENAQEHASRYTALMETIHRELSATSLSIGHTGHEEKARMRGSVVFNADADTAIRADHAGSYEIELTMTKQKDAEMWKQPKLIKLSEVSIGPKIKSLCAVQPPVSREAEPTAGSNYSKFNPQGKGKELVLGILDSAILAILSANPSRSWNDKDLAEAVAMREEVEIDSKALRNNWLRLLREDKTTQARHCYDPTAPKSVGKWRIKSH